MLNTRFFSSTQRIYHIYCLQSHSKQISDMIQESIFFKTQRNRIQKTFQISCSVNNLTNKSLFPPSCPLPLQLPSLQELQLPNLTRGLPL